MSFKLRVKGAFPEPNLMRGVSLIQRSPEINIFEIDIPFGIKQDLLKIKRELLPKYRIIRFSLDRPRRGWGGGGGIIYFS